MSVLCPCRVFSMIHVTCNTTGAIELINTPSPEISAGELLVQMNACGICGTDIMKVYDDSVHKPVQLGHELVATVVDSRSDRFRRGQRLAIAHHSPDYSSHFTRRGSAPMDLQFKLSNIDPGGFAELIRIPEVLVQHTVQLLPDEMPTLRAVFMEPLACCLRALDRIDLVEGDSALIVGVGAVGMLFVPLLRDRSVTTLAVDTRADRLKLAKTWGATDGALFYAEDAAELAGALTGRRGVDVVLLTVVTSATMTLALESVRDGGTILLFGTKPGQEFPLNWWEVWRREINIVSSYSSTPDLLPRAMAILNRPDYTLEALISHTQPLAEAASGFQLMHQGKASKVVITNG